MFLLATPYISKLWRFPSTSIDLIKDHREVTVCMFPMNVRCRVSTILWARGQGRWIQVQEVGLESD